MGFAELHWRLHAAEAYERVQGWDNLRFDGRRWSPRPRAWLSLLGLLVTMLLASSLAPPRLGDHLIVLAAFTHVSWGITARRSLLRGRHGGFRDVVGVSLALPLLLPPGTLSSASPAAMGGFVVATHMSFLTLVAPHGLSLSPKHFASASAGVKGLLAAMGLTCAALLLLGLCRASAPLLAVYVALGLAVAMYSRFLPAYHVHLHHYLIGGLLAPLCPAPWLRLICVGLFVEGAARWSMAPLWHGTWPPKAQYPPLRPDP